VKIDVHGNINIKRKIVVNGREYTSVEEMPADIRSRYEQAMASAGAAVHTHGGGGVKAKIVFNGREYLDVDTMPEEVRRLYETAMDAVRSGERPLEGTMPIGPGGWSGLPAPSPAPIEVGGGPLSSASRILTVGLVVLVLLGALYVLLR
jgi:hypothetical protein